MIFQLRTSGGATCGIRWFALAAGLLGSLLLTGASIGHAAPTHSAPRTGPAGAEMGPVGIGVHPALTDAMMRHPSTMHRAIVVLEAPVEDPISADMTSARRSATAVAASRRGAFDAISHDVLGALRSAETAGTVERSEPLWIAGSVAVSARPSVIRALAQHPDVAAIVPDRPWSLPVPPEALADPRPRDPLRSGLRALTDPPGAFGGPPARPARPAPARSDADAGPVDPSGTTWGVSVVRAPEVWRRLGFRGAGVTVGIADSGVDYHHPSLMTRYRGYRAGGPPLNDGNWYCASCGDGNRYPYDSAGQAGHGTHVAGTVLGGDGLGVAPDARWIAARACDPDDCADSTILGALQWFLTLGEAAPQIVNTSLTSGFESSTFLLRPAVDALQEAGILVVGSVGNGPGLIGAPGGLRSAVGVGAVTPDGGVWNDSRYGISPFGDQKPDVVAPGAGVPSAQPGGGTIRLSGTSMSSPHVAGAAALVLSAAPELGPVAVGRVLTSTARVIGAQSPAQRSGWGLVDAYAAVRAVTDYGTVVGRVVRDPDGAPIADARIRVTDPARDQVAEVDVEEDGTFSIDLQPGDYVVFAEAFGYIGVSRSGITVPEDGRVDLGDIGLEVETPRGTFSGRVVDGDNGAPVPTQLEIEGAPRPLETDELGFFSIQLPARTYGVAIDELGFRALTDEVKVIAGTTVTRTYELRPAPRILLVDGDGWVYGRAAQMIGRSLDRLGFVHDRFTVIDQRVGAGREGGPPSVDELSEYDLVIWSHSITGPAFVRGAAALAAYLDRGGRLILSGQDALCVDGGVETVRRPCDDRSRPHTYVRDKLHLRVVADTTMSRTIRGAEGGPLEGITVTLNGPDSLGNQDAPDVIEGLDPLHAEMIATYDDGGGAAVLAGRCEAHRAVALGFGLEGIAGDDQRDEVLGRLIDAVTTPEPERGVTGFVEVNDLIRPPGSTAEFTITLTQLGTVQSTYGLSLSGASDGWPAELWKAGFVDPHPGPITLDHCVSRKVGARVRIPEGIDRGALDETRLHVRSEDGIVERSVPLRTQAPAPVLVVDGEYQGETLDAYRAMLASAELPHDVWRVGEENVRWGATARTSTQRNRPSITTVGMYPALVWFVGYDFRDDGNLSPEGQRVLADYLDAGGRLLLSSEDFLWARGETPFEDTRRFHEAYLGVESYVDNAGAAHRGPIRGAPGSILEDLECRLDIRTQREDRSDRVIADGTARSAWLDIFDRPVAVQSASSGSRSLFLAFDAGRLEPDCGGRMMERAMDWFSPLADSRLELVSIDGRPTDRRAYASGETVRLRLILQAAVSREVRADVTWTLPEALELVPDTVPDGWTWDGVGGALRWSGMVQPGQPREFFVSGAIAPDVPQLTTMDATARIVAEGLAARRTAAWRVNAPDLAISSKSTSRQGASYRYGDEVIYFVNVHNSGSRSADPFLVTDTLPAGLRLVDGSWTITAGAGTVTGAPDDGVVSWRGMVPAGGLAAITYRARVETQRGGQVRNVAVLTDGTGDRFELSASIFVVPRLILPWLGREVDPDP